MILEGGFTTYQVREFRGEFIKKKSCSPFLSHTLSFPPLSYVAVALKPIADVAFDDVSLADVAMC